MADHLECASFLGASSIGVFLLPSRYKPWFWLRCLLGFIVIFLYSFLVSVSVGLVALVVAHLMKRFNKQASNPRLSVGILISLLVLCMVIQAVLFLANGSKPNSLLLEIIIDAVGI